MKKTSDQEAASPSGEGASRCSTAGASPPEGRHGHPSRPSTSWPSVRTASGSPGRRGRSVRTCPGFPSGLPSWMRADPGPGRCASRTAPAPRLRRRTLPACACTWASRTTTGSRPSRASRAWTRQTCGARGGKHQFARARPARSRSGSTQERTFEGKRSNTSCRTGSPRCGPARTLRVGCQSPDRRAGVPVRVN